jgi:MYXO-CTERM domain-containing protein
MNIGFRARKILAAGLISSLVLWTWQPESAEAGVITQTFDFGGTSVIAGVGFASLDRPFIPIFPPVIIDKFDTGSGTLDRVEVAITYDLLFRARSASIGLFPFSGFSNTINLRGGQLDFTLGSAPIFQVPLPDRSGSCAGTVTCTSILHPLIWPLASAERVFSGSGLEFFNHDHRFDFSTIGSLLSVSSRTGLPGTITGRMEIGGTVDVTYFYTDPDSEPGGEPGRDEVPEPGLTGMLVPALAGLWAMRRRRHLTPDA